MRWNKVGKEKGGENFVTTLDVLDELSDMFVFDDQIGPQYVRQ
jgi:hypothetical protein